jgi:PAS domain S-box-containing protein
MQIPFVTWKRFIDRFPDPIACYDQDYKHLYINEAIEKEINMPASQVIGKSNRDLNIPNNEAYLSDLEKQIRFVFETGKPSIYFTQHTFQQETRYYFMKLTPEVSNQQEQQGSIQSVWAVTRDITQLKQTEIELKQAEHELRKQNMELRQLNTDLDTTFFTVSHDLRTPLSNMRMITELIKAGDLEELPTYTKLLEEAMQRFDDILTGLTEILALKNKQEQVNIIELNTVFQVVLSEFRDRIHQTQTTVHADFSLCPNLCFITPYLESLFRNMLGNAIKYRSPARLLEIHIRSKRDDGFVQLVFQDNGQGMDLQGNEEKLFMPFFQIDSQQEGKGMGLTIVKNILERNGGKIEVKSKLNSGTTFTCYLKEINNLSLPGIKG